MEREQPWSVESFALETRSDVRHLQTDVTELRQDVRELRQDVRRLDGRIDQVRLVQLATLGAALASLVTVLLMTQ